MVCSCVSFFLLQNQTGLKNHAKIKFNSIPTLELCTVLPLTVAIGQPLWRWDMNLSEWCIRVVSFFLLQNQMGLKKGELAFLTSAKIQFNSYFRTLCYLQQLQLVNLSEHGTWTLANGVFMLCPSSSRRTKWDWKRGEIAFLTSAKIKLNSYFRTLCCL